MTSVDSNEHDNLAEPDPLPSQSPVSAHDEQKQSTDQASLTYNYASHFLGKKKRKISLSRDYIFVLWASQFDEIAATIFVTQLRDAGLRIKVVSPMQQKMPGEYGVALFADYTINRALRYASRAISVIIPSGLKGIEVLQDVRFFELFQKAHLNKAKFFISDMPKAKLDELELFPASMKPDDFIIYPEHHQLVEFVRQIPDWLPYALA